jgi:hypothetical protein
MRLTVFFVRIRLAARVTLHVHRFVSLPLIGVALPLLANADCTSLIDSLFIMILQLFKRQPLIQLQQPLQPTTSTQE